MHISRECRHLYCLRSHWKHCHQVQILESSLRKRKGILIKSTQVSRNRGNKILFLGPLCSPFVVGHSSLLTVRLREASLGFLDSLVACVLYSSLSPLLCFSAPSRPLLVVRSAFVLAFVRRARGSLTPRRGTPPAFTVRIHESETEKIRFRRRAEDEDSWTTPIEMGRVAHRERIVSRPRDGSVPAALRAVRLVNVVKSSPFSFQDTGDDTEFH